MRAAINAVSDAVFKTALKEGSNAPFFDVTRMAVAALKQAQCKGSACGAAGARVQDAPRPEGTKK